MRVRPVDGSGDMMPVQYESQMLTDARAVAQIIQDRIHLLYGEWWEDDTLGFRVPEMLVRNVRRGQTGMLEQYISQYIAGTEGVLKVGNVQTSFENHQLTYSCVVTTNYGSEALEVDLSGLL